MANIKSAKKDIKRTAKKTTGNTLYTSTVKNAIKKCEKAIKTGEVDKAKESLNTVIKSIDKCASKGLIKRNTCDRQKSRLNKKVKEMTK